MNQNSGWVFGKRNDLFVFTGPIILSLIIFAGHKAQFPGLADTSIHFLYLNIIFNLTHVYSTYWYSYTSPEEWKKNGKYFIFLPIFYFLVSVAIGYSFSVTHVFFFFSHFSLWHFMKQQQAWFYISSSLGEARDKLTVLIDKSAILSVTFGFSLASQSMEGSRGWHVLGDIVELPSYMRVPFLVISFSCIAAYFINHAYRAYKGKKQNWASHHIFLCALLLWGYTRLAPRSVLTFYLNQLHHSIPYLLLGYRYLSMRMKEGQKFWLPNIPFGWLVLGIFLITAYQGSIEMTIRNGDGFFENFHDWLDYANPIVALAFINSLSLTHFTLDALMWNKSSNPGWQHALGAK